VYVRGFLRSYANFLQLDPEPLVAELTGAGSRAAGPESFVPGPAVPAGQRVRRTNGRTTSRDPFARQAPARSNQPEEPRYAEAPLPPPLARPPAIEPEGWAPESEDDAPEPVAFRGRGVAVAPVLPEAEPQDYDDGEFAPEEETFHSRRVSGMLLERPEQVDSSSRVTRIAALVGVALVVLIGGLAAAVFLTNGGGDDGDNGAAAPASTPTPRPTNVIAVTGSPTASPTGSASASPSATESPSPTASVSPSPTGTETPAATPGTPVPTSTRGQSTPVPTQAPPTATNAPAPTNTPVPPTSTPTRIPTPAPTPTATPTLIPHPYGLGECSGGGTECGSKPWKIVCPPDGTWFLDVNGDFPSGNWAFGYANNIDELKLGRRNCGG